MKMKMKNFDKVCTPAIIVFILTLISLLADIGILGFYFPMFVCDIIIMIILVSFTLWFCSKKWIKLSWLISIILTLFTILGIYMYRNKDPNLMLELERQKRKQKNTKLD